MGFWSNLFFGENKKSGTTNARMMRLIYTEVQNKKLQVSLRDALNYINLIRGAKNNINFGRSLTNKIDVILNDPDYSSIYNKFNKKYFGTLVAVEGAIEELFKHRKEIPQDLINYLTEARIEFVADIKILEKYRKKVASLQRIAA
ncbi:hypothetical protein J4476_01210 [Candidatus Woesearchaeota archaeon]|nr:MAG: hypothetical protein QT09_C0014G0069 [archaeon GW2011_AR18]MBS3161296.1 hypothetical protein [Candidatus Woesearchaeota archaeon]HIH25754.1 hypothetical protein [Nanoarchaeota archaeon]